MGQMLLFLHSDEMSSGSQTLSWKWRTGMFSSISLVPVPSVSITTDHFPVFPILLGPSKSDLEYGLHWRFPGFVFLVKFSERRQQQRGRSVCVFLWQVVAGRRPSSIKGHSICQVPYSLSVLVTTFLTSFLWISQVLPQSYKQPGRE